jgi:hypothetical protein
MGKGGNVCGFWYYLEMLLLIAVSVVDIGRMRRKRRYGMIGQQRGLGMERAMVVIKHRVQYEW